jgi:hypothetical protein
MFFMNPKTKHEIDQILSNKDMVLFAIIYRTIINGSFASIIIKSAWFCQKVFGEKNKTLELKYMNKCYWRVLALDYLLKMTN